MEIQNLLIEKTIIHILDNSIEFPVLSEVEAELDNDLIDFLSGHIERILEDTATKNGEFIGDYNVVKAICERIRKDNDSFLRESLNLADKLFKIMYSNGDIPPGDVVFLLFKLNSIPHLGIIKLNYKNSYIHNVANTDYGRINSIIKQKTTLSSASKADEFALINLEDLSIKVLDKKYAINEEKVFYFSNMFLNCSTDLSVDQKIKIFNKATKKITKEYFDEDPSVHAKIKKSVVDSIMEKETIDIEQIARSNFASNPQLKNQYIEEIKSLGLDEVSIPVTEKIVKRNFTKQRLKTDSGIEINLPIELYGSSDVIEFINNPDGTISILIKNINKIINNK